MNCFIIIIYTNSNLGRHFLLGNFLKIRAENVLGASFRRLHVGIKVTVFGGKFKYPKRVEHV